MSDQNPKTAMQRKVDAERDRIDSVLAGAPALWTVLGILGVVVVGAFVVPFL